MAIVGLIILILFSLSEGSVWHITSFAIFGSMMVLLYMVSTIYHSITNEPLKDLFRKFDHMSIYLFIAGTYTPFCFTVLTGHWRWIIFGIVWGSAILGIILKIFFTGKKEILSTILYIILGWIVLFVIKPLYSMMSLYGFILLITGGLFYTVGTFFYIKQRMKYNHVIWHLFVLSGSAFHFFSVLSLLKL